MPGPIQKFRPPSPGQKIKRIKKLSEAAGMPKIGEALNEIYDAVIRNAVYHSDYILHDRKMHLKKDHRLSKVEKYYSQAVDFQELAELIVSSGNSDPPNSGNSEPPSNSHKR
jgi:hypothetical protein